jgi:hypothetical protein
MTSKLDHITCLSILKLVPSTPFYMYPDDPYYTVSYNYCQNIFSFHSHTFQCMSNITLKSSIFHVFTLHRNTSDNWTKPLFILLTEYLSSKLKKETMINYISYIRIILSAVARELCHFMNICWYHSTRGSNTVKQKGSTFLSMYLDNL